MRKSFHPHHSPNPIKVKKATVFLSYVIVGFASAKVIKWVYNSKPVQRFLVRYGIIERNVLKPQENNNPSDETKREPEARPIGEVFNNRPKPAEIVKGLLTENKIVLVSSKPGLGKSILVMQICIEAAQGVPSSLARADNTPQKSYNVIYYDFEMISDDYNSRYGGISKKLKELPMKLVSSSLTDIDSITTVEKLLQNIRHNLKGVREDTIIVIDTLTDISDSSTVNGSKKLMDGLKKIRTEANRQGYSLTMILEGHIGKQDDWKPTTRKDLQGSVKVEAFAESVIVIEPTRLGKDYTMIKILKQRGAAIKDTVTLLKRSENPYVHFVFVEEGDEMSLLPQRPKVVKDGGGNGAIVEAHGGKWKHTPETDEKMYELYHKMKAPDIGYGKVAEEYNSQYGTHVEKKDVVNAVKRHAKLLAKQQ